MIGERAIDGFPALTLGAPDAELEAAFVPEAGMVGCTLRHRGEELLGLRGGLEAYVAQRKTMGIPLLYPWANRLSRRRFTLCGREVVIDPDATPLRLDDNGLPMHGLLSAADGWRVERHEATADGAVLAAAFDFAAHDALMTAFPFPHRLGFEATLAGPALTIVTTVTATGDDPVPIAFGFHPYLRLPGIERHEWHVEIPVQEQLRLDPDMLPTGERVANRVAPGRLGRGRSTTPTRRPRTARRSRSGGGRRIELAFDAGYPFAQVYAPADDAVIAFEPMTAPTNALVDGGETLTLLAPGDAYRAAFTISVR